MAMFLTNTFSTTKNNIPEIFSLFIQLSGTDDFLRVRKRYRTKGKLEPNPETILILQQKLKYETIFYQWIREKNYNALITQ